MDKWLVSGRGVLHLSVLVETMRREGYELQVGQPQVIYKEIDGQRCEPIEELTINVPDEFSSKMIDMVTRRKGELLSMDTEGDRVNIMFEIPSRGIMGLRTNVLTASQGEAIMAHRFKEYQPFKGEITRRTNGSMIAMENGTAYAYSIDKLQDRGKFFIDPGEEVYGGRLSASMCTRKTWLSTNKGEATYQMCVHQALTTSARDTESGDELEECIEYIKIDEYIEVTPKSIRMRKILLDHLERKRESKE